MSPASQGSLEVERYIGSCLISSSTGGSTKGKKDAERPYRPQQQTHQQFGGGPPPPMCDCRRYGRSWTGMPLISMTPRRQHQGQQPQRSKKPDTGGDRTPLSRLAIHTQGAPLILSTGRYQNNGSNNRKNGNNRGQRQGKDTPSRRYHGAPSAPLPTPVTTGNVTAHSANANISAPSSDNVSVASDESSGHSENSLPRIIKPRKRRKKDRRPPPPAVQPTVQDNSNSEGKISESSNIVTLKPYLPLCYDIYKNNVENDVADEDPTDPTLVHDFEDVEEDTESEHNNSSFQCPPSLCQCRYCDPSGQIWDVDQHCYSPFLTPPSFFLPDEVFCKDVPSNPNSLFVSPPEDELFVRDLPTSPTSSFLSDNDFCSNLLRRSWSSDSSTFSGSTSNCSDFGVIGTGRKSRLNSTGTNSESSSTSSSVSPGLEVTTEIVTSLNGHRDLEIKFYSSSPPSHSGNISLKKPDINDSNISSTWSYKPYEQNTGLTVTNWGHSAEKCDSTWAVVDHEKTAKILGEEVNQLRLKVEE